MTKLERLLRREGLFIGAHRGYSERYPENTLLAVQEGIALGGGGCVSVARRRAGNRS